MADFTDAVRAIMIARMQGQSPETQFAQALIAQEINGTKSNAVAEAARLEEAWEKKASAMHARGVTPADLEWVLAFRDYQEDLRSARKWSASIQAAGERMLKKVGQ